MERQVRSLVLLTLDCTESMRVKRYVAASLPMHVLNNASHFFLERSM